MANTRLVVCLYKWPWTLHSYEWRFGNLSLHRLTTVNMWQTDRIAMCVQCLLCAVDLLENFAIYVNRRFDAIVSHSQTLV